MKKTKTPDARGLTTNRTKLHEWVLRSLCALAIATTSRAGTVTVTRAVMCDTNGAIVAPTNFSATWSGLYPLAWGVLASNQSAQAITVALDASNVAASVATLSAITSTVQALAYPIAHGQTASNLAAAAAAANQATSNSIAGAVSGYAYPLAWGVLASNLAAAAVSGNGDMLSNVFVTGNGVVKTAGVAQVLQGAGGLSFSNSILKTDVTDLPSFGGLASSNTIGVADIFDYVSGVAADHKYTSLWFTMPNNSPGLTRIWQHPDNPTLWYIVDDGTGNITQSNQVAFAENIPTVPGSWPGSSITSAVDLAKTATNWLPAVAGWTNGVRPISKIDQGTGYVGHAWAETNFWRRLWP